MCLNREGMPDMITQNPHRQCLRRREEGGLLSLLLLPISVQHFSLSQLPISYNMNTSAAFMVTIRCRLYDEHSHFLNAKSKLYRRVAGWKAGQMYG